MLDSSCGLVRPFVLHQSGNTVQLSAIDSARQEAQSVVSLQLPGTASASLQSCRIADGPIIVIQQGQQSLLVGFRGPEEASCRETSAPASMIAGELQSQDVSWQVHELRLPGDCKQRSLLWASSREAMSGGTQPHVCVLMGCSCGVEGEGHAVLELQYTPQLGWRAEQVAQSASGRLSAVCQVPQEASAALAAGIRAPAPRFALATDGGELLVFEAPSGQHNPKALLRALPELLEAQPDASANSSSAERMVLRGSLAERMQWPAPASAQGQEPSCRLLARAGLPHVAAQLAFVPDGKAGQLVAMCADRDRAMCCLNWPLLQQGPQLMGISALAANPSGLGIFINGATSCTNVTTHEAHFHGLIHGSRYCNAPFCGIAGT